ncbi:MAG: DUF2752 domain-containing protein [Clostridia bacterium]|nr:DUF2752 domain-containing protein [Clostridia bacterium]
MKGKTVGKVGVLLFFLLLILFLWRCPLRYFFGIACPGCGMTRALLAALRLDFAGAFTLHPLWWIVPFGALMLTVQAVRYRSLKRGAASLEKAAVAAAILLIVLYILRLILGDPVVMPDFSAGLAGRIISTLNV